jgi:hypothetical protein
MQIENYSNNCEVVIGLVAPVGVQNYGKINKTPMITSSQKNSFAIYYDGCFFTFDV